MILLSRSVQELDGKDVTEHERKYLVNLISRKKVQGTVYNQLKEKKEKMSIEGNEMQIHKNKVEVKGMEMLSF